MSVRRAVLGDESIVRGLRLAALADSPEAFNSTLEHESASTTADWSRWISNGATFLVEGSDGPGGIVAGVPYDGEPSARLLMAMWVEPRLRGTGAAAALVASVLAWAEAEGAAQVVLHVGKHNDRARRFYERTGFRTTGRGFISEWTGVEEVEMRYSLLGAARLKTQKTYNAASDHFDAAPLAFWDRYGQRTIERLGLRRGAQVLDVCCGAGASALPAARAVGPEGSVLAVDLADDLLELARAKARSAGIECVEFRNGDMTALDLPDAGFDAVVCVFGIFFVPDMEAQVARLWRLVRPGGQLAITTWGPRIFSPGYELWLEAVKRARPDLHSATHPGDRITTPEAVRDLFRAAGVGGAEVIAESGFQPLRSVEDFWTIAMGSGTRWTIDQMDAETARNVKREVLSRLEALGVDRVETNVIYAVARRDSAAHLAPSPPDAGWSII